MAEAPRRVSPQALSRRSPPGPTPADGILLAALVLGNFRALTFLARAPDPRRVLGLAWLEILLWLGLLGAVAITLTADERAAVRAGWRRNWPVALLVALALASTAWSLDPPVTAFRGLELLAATLVASGVGVRHRPSELVPIAAGLGAVLLVASAATALLLPGEGLMEVAPGVTAWRGVFWNKNHLGSLVALASAALAWRLLAQGGRGRLALVRDGCLYLLALVALHFARSATGLAVFVLLHAGVLALWLWVAFRPRLRA
ncbi:MAG TPA: hypothetical protein VLI67_08750, partial [Vicinamibacteria bacterium]|nr:hypothetical protein [Vicinamibacteria bacterium]